MICRIGWFALLLGTLSWSAAVEAQGLGPGTGPGGGMGPAQQQKPETPEGPAEAAPDTGGASEPELPALPPWPGEARKRLQFFELRGYLRFRADMQHNHNLGQTDIRVGQAGETRAPFYSPISERSDVRCDARRSQPVVGTGADRGIAEDACPARTLSGANMRLRLEPTINVAETVRVHSQIDILDNMVLGSTPNSLVAGGRAAGAPLPMLSDGQAAPIVGYNTNTPAILVKRAWAEVDTPVGELRFGRMPWHWGLGMLANDGSCWDCNFGNNQDRIMFTSSTIFAHQLGLGYDFSSNGPSSLSVSGSQPGLALGGQAIDLEQLDDVSQLFFFIGRIDRPEVIEEKAQRGDVVVNYGAYFLWRSQAYDYAAANVGTLNRTEAELATQLLERHASFIVPDVWFKLRWRALDIELEAALINGDIGNVSDDPDDVSSRSIMQYGFTMRSRYTLLNNQLKLGFEVGMASGDESELFDLNRRRHNVLAPTVPGSNAIPDRDLNEFRFDHDYHVDLILFREVMGTVANAAYFKPSVQFDLWDVLGARMDVIYSVAHQAIAYPGNSHNIGLELDFDLYYRNVDDGFSAGVQYGVLFPFAALDRPASIYGSDARKASIAQTLQARLIVKF